MLRISEESTTNAAIRLRLEGRVVGLWVGELKRVCFEIASRKRALTIDLSEVSFVDRNGIALFQDLLKVGFRFVNCSPYLSEQLKYCGVPCYRQSPEQTPETDRGLKMEKLCL